MNSVLGHTSASRPAASTPSSHEIACIILVPETTHLLNRGILWNARPGLCAVIVLVVVILVYFCMDKGEVFRYLGWIRPKKPVYWLYALAGGLCGAIAVIIVMRLCGQGLGHASASTLFYGGTLGPVIEEVFFRGLAFSVIYVMACNLKVKGTWRVIVPVLVTAAYFAYVHYVTGLLPLFLIFGMGIAYGLIRWRSGSTATSAVMHAVYNLTIAAAMALR